MKIKRSVLEKMVREELRNHIQEMMEGPKDDDKGADVVDAEDEKAAGDKKAEKEKDKSAKPQDTRGPKPKETPGVKTPKELPVEDEPEADPELEKDVAGEEEDADEVTGGKIADEITGKTLQSVTMEPKSKTLPGAQEIVLTFREIPDPLKILITKTGQVKFFFKGLHNEL
jgi:hypothetical protein